MVKELALSYIIHECDHKAKSAVNMFEARFEEWVILNFIRSSAIEAYESPV